MPWMLNMPPPPKVDPLLSSVLCERSTVPPDSLEMAPPWAAEFRDRRQSMTPTKALFTFRMAPPNPFVGAAPRLMVRPRIVTPLLVVTLKILNGFAAVERTTESLSAPGPSIEMMVLRSGSGEFKLRTHWPPAQLGSVGESAKLITSSPGLELAAVIAARKVHSCISLKQLTKSPPGSLVLLTVKVLPKGVIASRARTLGVNR